MKTIRQKAEGYAQSFFFSETPDEWDYEELTNQLRKEEGDFCDMNDRLNREDIVIWEPFEDYNPSWVADQMDMMAFQLTELFEVEK